MFKDVLQTSKSKPELSEEAAAPGPVGTICAPNRDAQLKGLKI